MMRYVITLLLFSLTLASCAQTGKTGQDESSVTLLDPGKDTVVRTEAEWKKLLTDEEYYILREKGTERAFTGKYWDSKADGIYHCAACGNPMFDSKTKFKSGTGWPSFYQPISPDRIGEIGDFSHGMSRTEVTCARCGGHLGHVFDDGPQPTGLRYCLNGNALDFVPREK